MRWKVFMVVVLSMLLAGCFRDASDERRDPTTVNIQTLNAPQVPQSSPTANTSVTPAISTLTPTPQLSPTNTFPVGGPPVNNANQAEVEVTEEVQEVEEIPPTQPPAATATLRSTAALIPSFTPAASGSTFGDPGITATTIATQPIPGALTTPTAFAEQVSECVYIVQANDTLFSIATKYNVTPDEFIAANPALIANPNILAIGQQLAVPNCIPSGQGGGIAEVTPTTTTTSVATVATGTTTHTVADGETLFRIAIQYNTTVEAIVAANPELGGSTLIYPGQVLVIPNQ